MKKKILIVDDEDDVRKSIAIVLEKQGYQIEEAEDGLEGIEKVNKEKFDLIILDVMMPKMSGWDVMKNILKDKKEYKGKIMFLSVVEISDSRKKELVKDGAIDYITKPFDIEELVKKVSKYAK